MTLLILHFEINGDELSASRPGRLNPPVKIDPYALTSSWVATEPVYIRIL